MVLTPKNADRSDKVMGILAQGAWVLSLFAGITFPFFPFIGGAIFGVSLLTMLFAIGDALCVAIDRHIPLDSPHRQTASYVEENTRLDNSFTAIEDRYA